ncbi:30S ribosomal protein S21 [Candidatus Woesebacteria bacterium GWA1_41_8]|uniref:Small ribosomal subunit protein bS21 n=1 Tax=Candidatus Woesebacteria bacterium GWA1_41_8 TaxID=1802471 RepID=A0A1F7WJB8_9BACT|nr:MAG: 30S ribosomal protein S21 [Candidatus Woesebacteria bacterium GWA1_41_8]
MEGGDEPVVVVKKQKGESEDRLIARFKKKVLAEGILLDLRERERYKKPAERRKEQKYRIKHQIELEKKRNY